MARVDVIQIQVLQEVVDHLRKDLKLLDSQCYMTIDPMNPIIPQGGDYWLSVSPGDGRFDEALQVGAVAEQCTEDSIVSVYGYTRIYLDQTNTDEELLFNDTRGILSIKWKIIKSLAGKDLKIFGDTFQRSLLTPSYATKPEVGNYDRDGEAALPIGIVGVNFTLPFDWDLAT